MKDKKLEKEDDELEESLKEFFHARPHEDCYLYEKLLYHYAYKEDLDMVSPSFTPYLERKVREHLAVCRHCYSEYLSISTLLVQVPTEEELQLIRKKVSEYSPDQESPLVSDQVLNWAFGLWERGKEWGSSLLPQGDLQPAFAVLGGVHSSANSRKEGIQDQLIAPLTASSGDIVKLSLDKSLSIKTFQGYWVTLFLKGPDEKREFIGSFTVTDHDDGVMDWKVSERPGTYQIEMYVSANAPTVEAGDREAFLLWFDREQGEKNRSETIVVIE